MRCSTSASSGPPSTPSPRRCPPPARRSSSTGTAVRSCPACTTTTSTCSPPPPPACRSGSAPRRCATTGSSPTPSPGRRRALAPTAWLRAVGYHESVAGDLDRAALDRLVALRPVRVQHRSGARWVLNSAAIDRLGLEEVHRPELERDPAGRLTGRVHRADAWLRSLLPREAPPDLAPLGAAAGPPRRHRRHRHHGVHAARRARAARRRGRRRGAPPAGGRHRRPRARRHATRRPAWSGVP